MIASASIAGGAGAADVAGPEFFISRAGPDADFAVRIARILKRASIRFVIQDRDIVHNSFMAVMHDALASGARTIALLSEHYLDPKRPHCAAEWQATIADDPLNREARLIVMRVGACAPTGLLKSLAYVDLTQIRDEALLADVVLGAVRRRPGEALPEVTARFWQKARPVTHGEIRATPSFTGRGEALADIHTALGSGAVAAITQPVAVHGLGGVGKSTLARQYGFEAAEHGVFAGVWWLNAERDKGGAARSYGGVERGLLELRELLFPGVQAPTERERAARGMLDHIASAGYDKPWLLVYDNVDDMRVLEDWPCPKGAHALVTTRLTTFREGAVAPIEITEWALPEAVDYLRRESGRGARLADADAEAIAGALGRLPLALSHAAAYLREMPAVAPAAYLAAIERWLARPPPGMEEAKPVYATFREAIGQAEAFVQGAAAVLRLAAHFAPDNIPLELYAQAGEHYPPELAAMVGGSGSHATVDEALSALARLSLIDLDAEAQAFSVHRLVQGAARLHRGGFPGIDSHADAAAWQQAAVAVLGAAYPGGNYAEWPRYERLLPHARHVAAWADDSLGLPLAAILHQAAFYLHFRATYSEAESLALRTLTIRKTALEPDHPLIGVSLNNLAGLYESQGKYELAERLYRSSLANHEKAFGPGHACIGRLLNNLAVVCCAQGRYNCAEPLYRRSLAIHENSFESNSLSVANTLNNFAGLYVAQGRFNLAEPLYKRSLAITEEALGSDHPTVAALLNNLAGVYRTQGKHDQAESLLMRSLVISETALGPDHPDVGTSLNSLASVYEAQGKRDSAHPLYQRSLRICEKALGPDHPNVGRSLSNLAGLELAQGKYDLAEPLYKRSLAISETALGPDHPGTAITLGNLAQLLAVTDRLDEATEMARRAHAIFERALGPLHPHTATAAEILRAIEAARA